MEIVSSNKGRDKLEERIEKGKASGMRIVQKVMTEVPVDRVVRGSVVDFYPSSGPSKILATVPTGGSELRQVDLGFHPWALQQACSRVEIPWRYVQHLTEEGNSEKDWGATLLAHSLNEHYKRTKGRYLIREINGDVRGWLSDRYRRLDSRPLLEAFATSAERMGAVPIEGYSSDTRVGLTALMPRVYEPVPGEYLAFGAIWQNSDFGNGKHEVSGFIDRVICANGAIMEHKHSQVHLGKQLYENMAYSERTYQLDTLTTASAIVDIVTDALSEKSIEMYLAMVKRAHEMEINPSRVLRGIKDLTQEEQKKIGTAFNSPDVEMMPAGNTAWRLSNAISWVAGNQCDDEERKLGLMKIAGNVMSV